MLGTILQVDHIQRRGHIHGDDGRAYEFDQEGMVLWLQFEKLAEGDRVRFDPDGRYRAVRIERNPR